MPRSMLLWTVPLALLAACSLKVGKDQSDANMASVKLGEDGNVAITANDGATGVSVSVPGLDASVKVPGMQLGGDHMDIDGMKLYPGTKLDGINVTDQKGPGNGQVDMRFTSPGTPDKLAAYYAAAARDENFADINVTNQGGGATLTARKKDDNLTISMAPAAGGSTTGRILIKDAGKD